MDIETGAVELLRLIAVDDAGTIISPVIAEGQVQGGLATGVAQALYEEVVYDEDGNPFTLGFVNYEFPSANDLPSFELHGMETPTPVQSAVVDALAPFGVRHVDMPASGERVWRALEAARPR